MITDLSGGLMPILFIHGLGCTSTADYVHLADRLTGHRRLLADLCLATDADAPSDHSIEGLARYLDAALTARKNDQVVLFGHSAGGAVALSLARLNPERVTGVILTECNLDPGGGAWSRRISQQSEDAFVAHGFAEMIAEQQIACPTWARTLEISDPAAVHQEAVTLVNGTTPTWREILYGLTCPRTYVFSDAALPDPDFDELQRRGVTVETIPNVGHNMAYENPEALADVVERFLGKH